MEKARRTRLRVAGMSCSVCERRIEGALRSLPGIIAAKAALAGGVVEVEYEAGTQDLGTIESAIVKAGYTVGGGGPGTAVSLGIGVLVSAAYLLASSLGLFNDFPQVDASLGYGMLFVIGLLTSVHCVAMCGGIALSQSLPRPDSPAFTASAAASAQASRSLSLAKLMPGLSYNAGRVLSYTLVGALVGALGSVLDFSFEVKGAITAIAGLFMLAFGLKMLGLIALPRATIPLPKPAKRALAALSGGGPFAVGLANGFMPCGPLQTMQLYALGAGSAFAGALSMFLFSVGTVPLLLGFGLVAAVLPRRLVPAMLKASAVLVMVLGFVTCVRAAALAGIVLPGFAQNDAIRAESVVAAAARPGISRDVLPVVLVADTKVAADTLTATVENGIQTVVTVIGPNSYPPFAVRKGMPVRWIVRVKAGDLTGCNNTIIVPAYKIRKALKVGDNLIEFTPDKEGVVRFSCWMGMIRSQITILPDPVGLDQPKAFPAMDKKTAASRAAVAHSDIYGTI